MIRSTFTTAALLATAPVLGSSVNYDSTCYSWEVVMGADCSVGMDCYTDHNIADAYGIAVSADKFVTGRHKSPYTTCGNALGATTGGTCVTPLTAPSGHGSMIGLTHDNFSNNIFYGLGNGIGRINWDAQTSEVILQTYCRVWGIAQHKATKDLYFGCRESNKGLNVLRADDSSTTGYESSAEILLENSHKAYYLDFDGDELYWTEKSGSNRVYKMNVVSETSPTVIAGTGTQGTSGDGGPAISAELNYPTGITINTVTKDIFIYDCSDCQTKFIRRISPSGVISTIASGKKGNWKVVNTNTDTYGTWQNGVSGATCGGVDFYTCCGAGDLAVDETSGDLYFANTYDGTVLRIRPDCSGAPAEFDKSCTPDPTPAPTELPAPELPAPSPVGAPDGCNMQCQSRPPIALIAAGTTKFVQAGNFVELMQEATLAFGDAIKPDTTYSYSVRLPASPFNAACETDVTHTIQDERAFSVAVALAERTDAVLYLHIA